MMLKLLFLLLFSGNIFAITVEEALLRAIVTNPNDDLPRLVYADWCMENNLINREQFIRHMITVAALERNGISNYADDAEYQRIKRRALVLAAAVSRENFPAAKELGEYVELEKKSKGKGWEKILEKFHRGFYRAHTSEQLGYLTAFEKYSYFVVNIQQFLEELKDETYAAPLTYLGVGRVGDLDASLLLAGAAKLASLRRLALNFVNRADFQRTGQLLAKLPQLSDLEIRLMNPSADPVTVNADSIAQLFENAGSSITKLDIAHFEFDASALSQLNKMPLAKSLTSLELMIHPENLRASVQALAPLISRDNLQSLSLSILSRGTVIEESELNALFNILGQAGLHTLELDLSIDFTGAHIEALIESFKKHGANLYSLKLKFLGILGLPPVSALVALNSELGVRRLYVNYDVNAMFLNEAELFKADFVELVLGRSDKPRYTRRAETYFPSLPDTSEEVKTLTAAESNPPSNVCEAERTKLTFGSAWKLGISKLKNLFRKKKQ